MKMTIDIGNVLVKEKTNQKSYQTGERGDRIRMSWIEINVKV